MLSEHLTHKIRRNSEVPSGIHRVSGTSPHREEKLGLGYIVFAASGWLVGCRCFWGGVQIDQEPCGECHSCYAGNAFSKRQFLLHFLNRLFLPNLMWKSISYGSS